MWYGFTGKGAFQMFAENLKTLRKAKGLSQEELAIRLNVVRQTVSKWEKGLSVPDADLLVQIADILEESVSNILGAQIENAQEIGAVAEQLSRINEQLAVKNRRARRIWKTIAIVLPSAIVLYMAALFLFNAPVANWHTPPAEDAYMAVFMEFNSPEKLSSRVTGDTYYISVDMEGVLHENPYLIKHRIENYLRDTDVILMWENMDALIEQGYISIDDNGLPTYFENGSLFSFNDITLTDTLYETEVSVWFGNLGGEGAIFEVKVESGMWEITNVTDMWIS